MTEVSKKRALAIILIIEAVIIVWLLTRRLAAVQSATPAAGGTTLNFTPGSYNGGNTTVGGLTTNPLNLTILFPGSTPVPTSNSCDCGCDENSPINQAQNQLAMFINQYQTGVFNAQKGFLDQISNAIPDWMQQYINSGGGLLSGGGV